MQPRMNMIAIYRFTTELLGCYICLQVKTPILKHKHLFYKISIIRLVIKYIFIINLLRDINTNTIYYINFVKLELISPAWIP